MFCKHKRFMSFLLALTLLCSLAMPVFAEDTNLDTGGETEPGIDLPQQVTGSLSFVNTDTGFPGEVINAELILDDSITFSTLNVTISYDPEKLIPSDFECDLSDEAYYSEDLTVPGRISFSYDDPDQEDFTYRRSTLCEFSFTIVETLVADSRTEPSVSITGTTADGSSVKIDVETTSIHILEPDDGIYTIAVTENNNEYGNATSNVKEAAEGDTITLRADPKPGYRFTGWSSNTRDVKFEDSSSRETTFVMPKKDVKITASFTKVTATTSYDISSKNITGGKFTAKALRNNNFSSVSTAQADVEIFLFATPDNGYYLRSWNVRTLGGENVPINKQSTPAASFYMPNDDVIVTPVFEKTDTDEYALSIHTNGFGSATSESYKYYAGDLVEIEAFADDDYQFSAWTSNTKAVEFDSDTSAHTTFVMPAENVVLTANFNQGEEKYKVSFQIVGGGSAATKNGKTEFYEGANVNIVATPKTGYRFYGWTTGTLSGVDLANDYDSSTSFEMPAKNVVITANFVEIGSSGGSSSSTTPGTTPGSIAGATGATGGQYQVIFNSTGGSSVATVRVNANALLAQPPVPTKTGYYFGGWYMDSACTIKYDFTQPVTHNFTLFARWTDSISFTDLIPGTWYYGAVTSLVQDGIMNGFSATTFAPNATLTRAQVAQILANLSGAVTSRYTYVPYDDVSSDEWYFNAVAWANDVGIIQGTSPTTFSPNAPVTRQDLAVLIHRYATNVSASVLPQPAAAITFADNAQIADYARNAVTAMQRAEVISGKSNNRFDPRGHATRAEVAKMIYQFKILVS